MNTSEAMPGLCDSESATAFADLSPLGSVHKCASLSPGEKEREEGGGEREREIERDSE